MYHSFLIHSSAGGHLGYFHVLSIIISASCWWTSRLLPCPVYYNQCFDEHWGTRVSFNSGFPWCICPAVGLLGHFHFSLSRIGEGNGNPLQCSCLENPRDGGAWWAAVYGVAQSRTWLKQLSSSSKAVLFPVF